MNYLTIFYVWESIAIYKKLKTLQLFDIKAGGIVKAKSLKEK